MACFVSRPPSLMTKEAAESWPLQGCTWTRGTTLVHLAPIPCRLGTTEVLTGIGPVLCLLQPLLFSVRGPALPLAGRWEGRMGARVQVPGCSLGSLFEDRGAGRQAPRASRLYAPLYAFTVLQWPRPTPTAVLPLPWPQVHLRGHSGVTPASALVCRPSGPTFVLGYFLSCPILLIFVLILSISEATLVRAVG